ncbi:MAG: hypothetical protein IPI81_17485 [Flavobacteriales bacterium]|nr:hypothetical protein [Flavobacteriales bacterium]
MKSRRPKLKSGSSRLCMITITAALKGARKINEERSTLPICTPGMPWRKPTNMDHTKVAMYAMHNHQTGVSLRSKLLRYRVSMKWKRMMATNGAAAMMKPLDNPLVAP